MNIINIIISIILIIKTCRLCCAVGMHRSIELELEHRARAELVAVQGYHARRYLLDPTMLDASC